MQKTEFEQLKDGQTVYVKAEVRYAENGLAVIEVCGSIAADADADNCLVMVEPENLYDLESVARKFSGGTI